MHLSSEDVAERPQAGQSADGAPRQGWLHPHWLWVPLGVFAVARVVSAVILTWGSARQVALGPGSIYPEEAAPGYWGVLSNWDGQWYRAVVEEGYPSVLPTLDGEVLGNNWAFLPGYPSLVRAVMFLTRLDFVPAASLTSMVCAATATVLVYRLMLVRGDRFFAFAAVVLVNFFPSSPIFQVAYTEGLVLLLVVCILVALHRQRYVLLVPLIVALSLTRPLTLVVAALLGLHLLRRLRGGPEHAPSRRELTGLLGLGLLSVSLTGLWPAVAGIRTGEPSAYLRTMSAWAQEGEELGLRANWIGQVFLDPGALLVAEAIAAAVIYRVMRGRVLVPELRDWSWLYPLYMMAATTPAAGIFRYLLLSIAPLCLLSSVRAQETRADRTMRVAVLLLMVAVCVVGQVFWVKEVYIMHTDFQPFP